MIGWPVRLGYGDVGVRPVRYLDGPAWADLRRRNEDWLAPWEATPPDGDLAYRAGVGTFVSMARHWHRSARAGRTLPFAVTYAGRLAGQLNINNIVRGSLNAGAAGYWVDREVAGRGVMPTALALVADHCFRVAGLHRLEANVQPDNRASRRVVEKLGFVEEGLRRRYLHIAGEYRDHICYALTPEDVPEGVLRRWLRLTGQ